MLDFCVFDELNWTEVAEQKLMLFWEAENVENFNYFVDELNSKSIETWMSEFIIKFWI